MQGVRLIEVDLTYSELDYPEVGGLEQPFQGPGGIEPDVGLHIDAIRAGLDGGEDARDSQSQNAAAGNGAQKQGKRMDGKQVVDRELKSAARLQDAVHFLQDGLDVR